jgi:hypothetical protein
MKFLGYLFKKDLIRLKWILICWLLLLGVQCFLGISGARLAADNFGLQIIIPELQMLIGFMQGIMLIIIIPLLIQDEPLVGTTGFWFTRPIGRKDLFITKTWFVLGVLILLLVAAAVIVFAANHFMLRHILLAIPQIVMEKLAFMMPFILLASITPKFSRYAMAGIIIFAAYIVMMIAGTFMNILCKFSFSLFTNLEAWKDYTLGLSVDVVKDIFIIAAGTFLAFYQYARRKAKRTVALAVAAFIIMLLINRFWSIDFLKPTESKPIEQIAASQIKLSIDTNQISIADAPRYSKNEEREKIVTAAVTISGLRPDEFAIITSLESRIKIPDRSDIISSAVSTRSNENIANAKFMGPIRAALPNAKLVNPFATQVEYQEIFRHNDQTLNFLKSHAGTYSVEARFDIYKYQLATEAPLRQGARKIFDSEQIVIFDVLDHEGGISVLVGEKKANLLFDRTTEKSNPLNQQMSLVFPRNVYLVINEKTEQAFVEEPSDSPLMNFEDVFNANAQLASKSRRLDFEFAGTRLTKPVEVDKQWLAGDQLVRLDAVKVGTVTKTFEIPGFQLPQKSTLVLPQESELDKQIELQKRMEKETGPKH